MEQFLVFRISCTNADMILVLTSPAFNRSVIFSEWVRCQLYKFWTGIFFNFANSENAILERQLTNYLNESIFFKLDFFIRNASICGLKPVVKIICFIVPVDMVSTNLSGFFTQQAIFMRVHEWFFFQAVLMFKTVQVILQFHFH